jgi:DNA protecting protein dprA
MTNVIEEKNENYPIKIKECLSDYKPIYYRGNLSLLDKPSIAIVGSRKASSYGKSCARALAKCAVEYGAVVVSGLALGIDSEAHSACLENRGETIAVLANGVDVFYPKRNQAMQKRIEETGLLLSEYEDGTRAQRYTFPVRNRIISAISDAIVIVEAGSRSGSLITAECAQEQGKEVYSIPGNITSPGSLGTNKLIRDGAVPLINFDELFEDLGLSKSNKKIDQIFLSKTESRVLEVVKGGSELSIEQIRHIIDIDLAEINAIITILEMKGLIFCEMGKVSIANLWK